jgi:transposase
MTLEDSILAMRLRVMVRAAELKNVAATCREAGISRTLFYRWRRRFERYGREGLHPRRRRARPGRPPQVPPHVERLVVGQALAWPTWGGRRVSLQLSRDLGVAVSPSTVQRILRRAGRGRRRDRPALLEHHSAGTCGVLSTPFRLLTP